MKNINLKSVDKLEKKEYFSELYQWTIKKEKVHNISKLEKKILKKEISLKLWQIWWYNVWINIWKEIWKTEPFLRPCLIINNNMWSWLIGIFPIYWWKNYNERFLYKIKNYWKYWLTKWSNILLNQYKTISLKRLVSKINDTWWKKILPEFELNNIIDSFKKLF